MPRRATLSSYAGPMPRPVVPMRLAAGGLLAGLIQGDVVRHDQRRGRADLEARAHFDAAGLEFADFLLQRAGVQHDAVADQAQRVVAQDAGGDQVQDGLLAADDEGVAGVVAALEAHDARRCPASAGRRSCPCLRRPTGRPTPRLTDPSENLLSPAPGSLVAAGLELCAAGSRGPDTEKAGGAGPIRLLCIIRVLGGRGYPVAGLPAALKSQDPPHQERGQAGRSRPIRRRRPERAEPRGPATA